MLELLKETFSEWQEDHASRLAAALAYYTVFSLAPLLIIVIAIAGLVFKEQAVQGQIVTQIQSVVGKDAAGLIQTMIANTGEQGSGVVATVIGIATLLLGASGVFAQLQDALDTIWEVAPAPDRGILGTVIDRLLSFSMVLGIGFLLLVSFVVSAAISAVGSFLTDLAPELVSLWQIVNFLVSFGVITLLFAMIYKVLPDAEIAWGDVWIGAAVTSLLFTVGKLLIGLYLGQSGVGSAFGAAGSLVVLLVWVFYSAQIFLFGAEFTQVYARRFGSRIVPAEGFVRATAAPTKGEPAAPRSKAVRQPREPAPEPAPEPRDTSSPKRRFIAGLFTLGVGVVTFGVGRLIGTTGDSPEA